ncbi:F0F1 ATP synthase subunit delta [uncultured Nocardioides sp.]|uniref:F0F1 ATP synthase subunit delta n=1 Tax=uncultured Nocardioides sp. TaxID=198441 RepID=UPI0025DA381F|nr:F0F1 ATP synthase subunit delta [uncultured Nocardioides sp.]
MSFRGASAEAYASLRSVLDEQVRGDAEAAGRAGDDLFAVAQLMRREASLRRVATDVSLPASAKQGLVRQILAGRVAAQAAAVVDVAVAHRWTGTRDLPEALETLGEVAVVRSTGSDSGRLADELFVLAQTVNDAPGLRDALSDPSRSTGDKVALLQRLLSGRALPATLTLATQALAGTYRTVTVALATYQQVAAEVHGEKVATVKVARPLSDADRQRLTDALSRQYDREIHLNVVVDPDVIGGIRVEIGDDVIDGTVVSRLDDARRKLAG